MKEKKTRSFILKTVGVVGSATFTSRITGMIRDMATAAVFGTGFIWDAYVVAFRIPNLFRRLFGEGALSGAVIPVATDYLTNKGKTEANRFLNNLISAAAVFLFGLTALVIAILLGLLKFSPHLTPRLELIYRLAATMMPYLLLICLTGVFMGILNALKHFFVPAISTVILNLSIIGAVFLVCPLLGAEKTTQIFAVAGAVVFAGIIQLASHFYMFRKKGMHFKFSLNLFQPGLVRVYKLMLPSILGLSITQINILVSSFMAVYLGSGAVSALYYGDRLMEFPQGLFGVSIATAILPVMAEKISLKDTGAMRDVLHYALDLCMLIMIPATAGYLAIGSPIVSLLFERGNFDPVSTANTAWALGFYSLGLFAFAGSKVLTHAFYSLQDTKTPVKIGIAVVIINLIGNYILMQYLYHAGLALANSISAIVNFYLLLRFMDAKIGCISYRRLGSVIARSALASAAMFFVVKYVYISVFGLLGNTGTLCKATSIFTAVGAGMVTVFGGYLLLGIDEARNFSRSFVKRLKSPAQKNGV